MPFVVEDGSIISGANSYVSVADCEAYWNARNVSDFASLDSSAKEASIIAGTQFIDTGYRFRGDLLSSTQDLQWPRSPYTAQSGKYISSIPQALKDAVCEMAYEYAQNGVFRPSQSRGNEIKKVKAGSVEVEYNADAPNIKTFGFIKQIMRDLIIRNTNSVKLVRS